MNKNCGPQVAGFAGSEEPVSVRRRVVQGYHKRAKAKRGARAGKREEVKHGCDQARSSTVAVKAVRSNQALVNKKCCNQARLSRTAIQQG